MCRRKELFVLTELTVWWKTAAWKQQLQCSEQEIQRRKASQRSTRREPERKRHKEKPGGAEKEEGGSEDTQKRLERERERGITDVPQACTPTPAPLLCTSTEEVPPSRPNASSCGDVGVGLRDI